MGRNGLLRTNGLKCLKSLPLLEEVRLEERELAKGVVEAPAVAGVVLGAEPLVRLGAELRRTIGGERAVGSK